MGRKKKIKDDDRKQERNKKEVGIKTKERDEVKN